jgi:hypothetical protein
MVLLATTLVVMSCSTVENAPADITIETTSSVPGTETTTSSMTEKESSDSAADPVHSDVHLEWTEAELSGSFVGDLYATEDGFVAYGFAHRTGAWASQDGVHWTPRDLLFEADSDELAVHHLTAGGPGYVAIGSDPATPTGDDHPAVWISDDGFDWERHDLVIESPHLGRFAEVNVMSVMGGPDGRLILVGRMDPPDGGFDEHEFVVWTSRDGLDWSLQTESFPPGSYIDDPVYVTSHGFIVNGYVEGGGSGEAAWLSADGERWDELSLDFTGEESYETAVIGGSTRRVVSWDDRILIVAGTPDGIGLWVSDDGGDWTALSPDPAISHTDESIIWIDDVTAGPAGIAMTGRFEPRPPEPQPLSPASVEKGQRVLTVDFEAETLTVTDLGDGEVLLEIGLEDAESVTRIDDESLTVIDPETGEELISVTHEEWDRALEGAGLIEPVFEEAQPAPMLWFSPDGEYWTVVDVNETFGTDHTPSEVVVGGESVLFKWSGLELTGYEEKEITGELEDPPAVIWVAKLVGAP